MREHPLRREKEDQDDDVREGEHPPPLACRIARADALAALRELPEGSCGLLLADPPYCSGGLTRTERKAAPSRKYQQDGAAKFADFPGDQRDERSFVLWSVLWMSEAWRALEPGASALVFSDWRQLANTADAVQAAGFVFRGIVPWAKTQCRPQPNSFRAECEYVVWATKGDIDRSPSDSAKYLPGIYRCAAPTAQRGREHMNQKPVALLRDLMAISPDGCTVLDPFMGSGSTGVACAETGRSFVGIEMTEHYYGVARARIAEAYSRG